MVSGSCGGDREAEATAIAERGAGGQQHLEDAEKEAAEERGGRVRKAATKNGSGGLKR